MRPVARPWNANGFHRVIYGVDYAYNDMIYQTQPYKRNIKALLIA